MRLVSRFRRAVSRPNLVSTPCTVPKCVPMLTNWRRPSEGPHQISRSPGRREHRTAVFPSAAHGHPSPIFPAPAKFASWLLARTQVKDSLAGEKQSDEAKTCASPLSKETAALGYTEIQTISTFYLAGAVAPEFRRLQLAKNGTQYGAVTVPTTSTPKPTSTVTAAGVRAMRHQSPPLRSGLGK